LCGVAFSSLAERQTAKFKGNAATTVEEVGTGDIATVRRQDLPGSTAKRVDESCGNCLRFVKSRIGEDLVDICPMRLLRIVSEPPPPIVV
jgi:hypothetical protein